MINEGGEAPKPKEFDYNEFKNRLESKVSPSPLALYVEKTKNTLLERTGRREKEAEVEVTKKSLQFSSKDGERFDPLEELQLDDLTFTKTDEDDFGARTSIGKKEINIPESWVNGEVPHQGLKILHEIAHIAVAEQNPGRRHIIDDVRTQQLATSRLLNNPDQSLGDIVDEINALSELGYISDLGFSDFEERRDYISQLVHNVKRVADDGLLKEYFGQLSLTEYELRIEEERKAWALALSLYRKARQKGVVIDNRSNEQIFEMIDLTLATNILPDLTHAVKRKSFRKEMGLPETIEDKPDYLANPLHTFTEYTKSLQEISDKTREDIKKALHLNEREVKETKITPITQVDSRIIKKSRFVLSRIFGEGKEVEIDRKTEAQVRLACLAYYSFQKNWQNERIQDMMTYPYFKEQIDKWGAENMKIVGTVNVSSVTGVDGRYMVTFRTTDVGKGSPKGRVESNTVFFDEKVDDLEGLPVPVHRDREDSFLFAYRHIPHEGSDYTGFQLVGERMQIIKEAGDYAQKNNIPEDQKVARYLESRGYDINTVGSIWVGMSGTFSGYLKE